MDNIVVRWDSWNRFMTLLFWNSKTSEISSSKQVRISSSLTFEAEEHLASEGP